MLNNINLEDISKNIHSYRINPNQQIFLSTFNANNKDLVSLPEDNIQQILKFVDILLDGSDKVIITNKNQQFDRDFQSLELIIKPKKIQLIAIRNLQQWNYLLNLEENNLYLNFEQANLLDSERFKEFFDNAISNIVKEKYEVIRNE